MGAPKPNIESTSHVTDEEAKAVADFAMEVGELLSLPRYRYNVMIDPCDEDALGSIHTVQHRWIAEIYLCESWMERSDEDRMNTVIHEVCHLLHRDVDHVVDQETGPFLHEHEHRHLKMRYRREVELMVDHLANFITEFTTVRSTWDKLHSKKK